MRGHIVQHGTGISPGVAMRPGKRVTFSKAAAPVKEQKQPAQGKTMSRGAEGSAGLVRFAPSQLNNSRGSKYTAPHSKISAAGASSKTRLHCNHLMPKCKCPNTSNRKKAHKAKHAGQGAAVQRRVLSSSCAVPRGEMNGRKTYQSTEESVSICDATWTPILNNSQDSSKISAEDHNHRQRNGNQRDFKKKLRFEDQVTRINSVKDMSNSTSQNHGDTQSSSCTQATPGHHTDNSSTHSDGITTQTSGDYCKLCEAPDKRYFTGSQRIKKKDQVHNDHSKCNTSKFYPEQDFSIHNELCFLCHRYANHKCICDDTECKICNTHLYCSQKSMAEKEHSSHQRVSPSAQAAGSGNKCTPGTKIPYEPRTKFVQNLKEKLETTYKEDNSKQKRRSEVTSAALRATQSSRDSHSQHASQAQHTHHGKKCLHHYQQNDRLFLEPTITNRKGQSVCGECGAAQPKDPQKEPYLYHITLGGLRKDGNKQHNGASVNRFYNVGKENTRVCNMKSKKVSNDKSKFLYAKLNDSINNILYRKDLHSAFSRPSAPSNYPAPPHTKRPASRSMALVDHII